MTALTLVKERLDRYEKLMRLDKPIGIPPLRDVRRKNV